MLIIFDKDNTLVHSLDGRPANTLEEQVLIEGVVERCAQLRAKGHTLAVASNQGGVAFGYFSVEDAHALVARVAEAIGAQHYAVCVCHPHGDVPGAARESAFRKPNPGMLLYLMDALGFDARETIYVGDRDEDREAAGRAGVRFAWAQEFFAQEDFLR